MYRLVLIYLLLWSPLYTVFAHEKCARFDIPNVRNNILTLLDNREESFFFNITNYRCIEHGNFRVKVAKISADNYQKVQCVLRHENFICQTPATQGGCACTDHAGTYMFTRRVDSSDSVRWRFWVKSSLVNGVEIEEEVEEEYVAFSVVLPQSTPSSPESSRPATVTPHTQGESGTENADSNTTGKRESPHTTPPTKDKETTTRFTDTDSLTHLTTVHGDDDANLMLIYIIVGVVASIIAVAVIISSVIYAVKACRSKHRSPQPRGYKLRQALTLVLGDGRQSHQEVTRLRPLGKETQTQQPAEGAVFQNQLYHNPHVFLVQPSHNDNDDYLVPVVR